MNKFLSTISLFVLLGCADKISEDELESLNGYWEIEKVVFPDGNSKEYGVNTNIDYILVDGKKGFRKKVRPKLDGTYGTSNDTDPFMITERDNRFLIHYTANGNIDPEKERVEELTSLSGNKFSVVNADGLTYVYKRFEPFDLNDQ